MVALAVGSCSTFYSGWQHKRREAKLSKNPVKNLDLSLATGFNLLQSTRGAEAFCLSQNASSELALRIGRAPGDWLRAGRVG